MESDRLMYNTTHSQFCKGRATQQHRASLNARSGERTSDGTSEDGCQAHKIARLHWCRDHSREDQNDSKEPSASVERLNVECVKGVYMLPWEKPSNVATANHAMSGHLHTSEEFTKVITNGCTQTTAPRHDIATVGDEWHQTLAADQAMPPDDAARAVLPSNLVTALKTPASDQILPLNDERGAAPSSHRPSKVYNKSTNSLTDEKTRAYRSVVPSKRKLEQDDPSGPLQENSERAHIKEENGVKKRTTAGVKIHDTVVVRMEDPHTKRAFETGASTIQPSRPKHTDSASTSDELKSHDHTITQSSPFNVTLTGNDTHDRSTADQFVPPFKTDLNINKVDSTRKEILKPAESNQDRGERDQFLQQQPPSCSDGGNKDHKDRSCGNPTALSCPAASNFVPASAETSHVVAEVSKTNSITSNEKYVVDGIDDRDGERYFVRWKGYILKNNRCIEEACSRENTWESESSLLEWGCAKMVADFNKIRSSEGLVPQRKHDLEPDVDADQPRESKFSTSTVEGWDGMLGMSSLSLPKTPKGMRLFKFIEGQQYEFKDEDDEWVAARIKMVMLKFVIVEFQNNIYPDREIRKCDLRQEIMDLMKTNEFRWVVADLDTSSKDEKRVDMDMQPKFGRWCGMAIPRNEIVHARIEGGKHYMCRVVDSDDEAQTVTVTGMTNHRQTVHRHNIIECCVRLSRFYLRAGDLKPGDPCSAPYSLLGNRKVGAPDMEMAQCTYVEFPDPKQDKIVVNYINVKPVRRELVPMSLVEFAPKIVEKNFAGK